jgi:hypothetical protein
LKINFPVQGSCVQGFFLEKKSEILVPQNPEVGVLVFSIIVIKKGKYIGARLNVEYLIFKVSGLRYSK